jgi:hypothetical protein
MLEMIDRWRGLRQRGIETCVPGMGRAATLNWIPLIWLLADASLQERLSGTCPYKGETNRPQPRIWFNSLTC